MKKRLFLLLVSLSLPILLSAVLLYLTPTAQTAPLSQDKLDDLLRQTLADSSPADPHRFIVHLSAEANLATESLPTDKSERTAEVVSRLQQTAATSQAGLIQQLQTMKAAGTVSGYQPLWIVNAVIVTGTAEAITALASLPDVTHLLLDAQHQYLTPPQLSENENEPLDGGKGNLQNCRTNEGSLSPCQLDTPQWNIQQVRAMHAQVGLGIDGSGVTIAIMDSGVDWLHPDLSSNYRGNNNGNIVHTGNWYDTVNPSNSAPVDPNGHGTHVSGLAAGQNGLGVAPGAKWIAVRAFDEYGLGYLSNIHAAFQWLLAPAGNPALAPDVVNGSWGAGPFAQYYLTDVLALRAAGIVQVFAAGNSGPGPGSISAPAGYAGALSVGASDDINYITWFSARGPSVLNDEIKPSLVAPGSRVLSTWPGGQYRAMMGTSMAAPHVSGAAAILLSADPSLTELQLTQLLTSTARPLSTTIPNYSSGWGLLDVYAAAAGLAPHGVIQGIVSSNGLPLPGVLVTITTPGGTALSYQTDENGRYEAPLQPGTYSLTVAPYAFVPQNLPAVVVSLNQVNWQNINLTAVPQSLVSGHVIEASSGQPLTGYIIVPGTPITASLNSAGNFSLYLPAGSYELLVFSRGHRLGRATITVAPTTPVQQNFVLQPGPAVLLIDSGQWYYDSYRRYFQQALEDSDYAYDLWPIRDPFVQLPTAAALDPYDVVVWTAPIDSPGYLGADNALYQYLEEGGNLFISGQEVAFLDFAWPSWWIEAFDARMIGEADPPLAASGEAGSLFDGLAFTLNGPDSAGNQIWPDQAAVNNDALSQVVMRDGEGAGTALQSGLCENFRAVYLGFGLEGVNGAAERAELIGRSLAYFTSPRNPVGVRFRHPPIDDIALPGATLTYSITLQNLSETTTDQFHLEIEGASWPAALSNTIRPLRPCESREVALTIQVPAGLPINTPHSLILRATSGLNPNISIELPVHHKTPGQFLLVDDDRWYDQQPAYRTALDEMGLLFDVWATGSNGDGRGSPPLDLLDAYDLVIWYTGYDWFAPITTEELYSLTTYLEQGGRLFLSSQDYLYYHFEEPFSRQYLGVAGYQESITPTVAYGTEDGALSGRLGGPLPLSYPPYQNFSDGLIPAAGSQVALWHDRDAAAAGLATSGDNWRSLFWAIPLEKLPPAAQLIAINQAIGWLSDLGDSTFEVDQRAAPAGVTLAYTLTLRNLDQGYDNYVAITNTLPPAVHLLNDTLSGGASYDPLTRQITWQGTLASGGSQVISYEASTEELRGTQDGGSVTQIDNPVDIFYDHHHLQFERVATTWLDGPDYRQSSLASQLSSTEAGRQITYTFTLRNDGFDMAPAEPISAGLSLPRSLFPITNTLSSSGSPAELLPGRVQWQGYLQPGQAITVSLVLTGEVNLTDHWLAAALVIEDGVTYPLVRENFLFLAPQRLYFPFIARP